MTKNNRQRWGCIYKLTNQVNGKYYFGKTIDFKTRMSHHKCSAKKGKLYLARAIRKHGWSSFKVEILIDDVPEEDLDNLERSYIEIYDSNNPKKGYNLTKGGEGTSGWVPSQEWRKNISKKMKLQMSKRDRFGSVSYLKPQRVYIVHGPSCRNHKNGKYVGQYNTKEEAEKALEIFNTTGNKTPSNRCGWHRKKRSGSVRLRGKVFECSNTVFYSNRRKALIWP